MFVRLFPAADTKRADYRMIVETRGGKILLYQPGDPHPVQLKP